MLMIVSTHFAGYSGFDLSVRSVTWSKIWCPFLRMGQFGNVLFVLISGYFLIDSKGVKISKVINLWLRLIFYSVLFYALFFLCGLTEFNFREMAKSFFPVSKYHWWFASTYFLLYLIHDWLNIIIRNLSHDDYKKLLLSICIFWSVIPMMTNAPFSGFSIISFVCVYFIAGYIKLWGSFSGSRKYIILSVIFMLVNYALNLLTVLAAAKYSYFEAKIMYFSKMHSTFIVLSSICLFIAFKNLKVKYIRAVNIIASATFGVYLIHEDYLVRPFLWQTLLHSASFQDSPYLIPYSIAVILIVYIFCTVIELIRAKLFKLLSGGRLS